MNQFLSNKIIAGIVALALLVGVGVLISSGDTSSTTRNAALVVATPCTKPGQVTKVSKQSVVCATTNTGSLWYATMKAKGKTQPCTTPGEIRKKSKIVWVCGVIKKKKLWQATQPLTALAVEGDLPSTTPATPDAPVVADNAVLADPAVIDTAAPAKPAALSLETQPLGGVNALALESQPVVQLLDQGGASISTAGITITAVSGRTDVVLSGNTAVTDATGRATFTALSLKGIMGEIALTFTAPRLGLEGVTSGNLDLAAGVATALVSDTKLGAVAAGQRFNQFHKLHLQDSGGNVVAISGRDVVVSSSTEGPYGYTTEATASDGYVLFKDLTLTQTGTTTLTFTSGDLSTTSTVMVMPGDSQGLKITTEASEAATNGVPLARGPVVQLLDADGNNVTTPGFKVTATITQFSANDADKTSTLLVSTAVTNAQGVATFTGLIINGLIGTYTLGFTPAGGVTQASDKTVTLSAGEPKKLAVLTAAAGLVGNSEAGTWSLTQSPVIGLRDISNNPVTTSNVTVTATVIKQDPTFSADTDALGKATFPIIFSGNDAGLRRITYKASNVIDLTADITLPLLTSVLTKPLAFPATTKTTDKAFLLTAPESKSGGAWTYASSDARIAEVDQSTGEVTPRGATGQTRITATQAQTTKYTSTQSWADLRIDRASPGLVTQPLAYPFNYDTTSGPFSPSSSPTSNSNGAWTYTSDQPAIAEVNPSNGRVTPKGVAGTVTITATQAATAMYESISTDIILNIRYQAPVYGGGKNVDSVPFDPLTRPASKSTVVWRYESLNPDIATVDQSTGKVTPKGVAGTVTITATQAALSPYAAIISEVTVVISGLPVVVSPAWVLMNKYTDSSSYTPTAPTSNSNGVWTYTSSEATIAEVDQSTGRVTPKGVAGTTTITATHSATTRYAKKIITADLRIYKSYQVGEAGPGGGTVFYVAPIPQTWGRYLEAAPTDFERTENGIACNRVPIPGVRGGFSTTCFRWHDAYTESASVAFGDGYVGCTTTEAIGTGKANTDKILACPNVYGLEYPAVHANKYSTSTAGAGQWFLPSKDELNEWSKYARQYTQPRTARTPGSGFVADKYWSSTVRSTGLTPTGYIMGRAGYQDFSDGSQGTDQGGYNAYVRPVRAF